jgi:hypothetical protein
MVTSKHNSNYKQSEIVLTAKIEEQYKTYLVNCSQKSLAENHVY